MKVEAISHIHIGSGEKYGAAEFVVKDSRLYRLDFNRIYLSLPVEDRDRFVKELENPQFNLSYFLKGRDFEISDLMIYSADLRSEIPHRDIEACIKTNFETYIPGSSIKGSIRTAIFYNMVKMRDIQYIDKIFDERKYWKRNRELTRLFTTMISGNTRSPHSDVLKFLQITDSHTTRDIAVYTTKILDIYHEKWSWCKRGDRELINYLEVIPAGTQITFELKINKNEGILEELGLQTKGKILDEDGIKREVYNFSKDLIDYEIEFAKKYGIDFLFEFYSNIQTENEEDKPLLKLGHGSGFLGTTICLKLKNEHPRLYEKVRRSLRGRSHSFEFPKTRKVVFEDKVPLGWCKVS